MYTWMCVCGQGADGELQVSTIHTTSYCSALSKVLTEDKKVLLQVKSFRGSFSLHVQQQQKEDSSYIRGRSGPKKPKTRKPCGFQVKQCLCQLHIMFFDKSYNAPERRWNTAKMSRKVSKISQEKVTTPKTIACELQQARLWLQCSFQNVSILLCDVNLIWSFNECNLPREPAK